MRRLRTSASKPSGQFVEPKIREHRGRTLKNTGDGFLSEFSSVANAVRCAIEIQRGMLDRERSVPKERRILFRIGINLGDVIFEDRCRRIGVDLSGVTLTIKPQLDGVNVPPLRNRWFADSIDSGLGGASEVAKKGMKSVLYGPIPYAS